MRISERDLRRVSAKLIGVQRIEAVSRNSPRGIGVAFIPIVKMENGIIAVLGSYATHTTLN